jgi:hypothetical protein
MLTKKELFRITWFPVLVASLSCLAPVLLLLFGLSTLSAAASLSDILYGRYKWWFFLTGLVSLAASFILSLRRGKGICTLNEAKRRRNEILNTAFVSLGAALVAYLVWTYVIVELVGYSLGLWR